MADEKENVFVKLPLRLRNYYTPRKKKGKENVGKSNNIDEECEKCFKDAANMGVDAKKLCPDCAENNNAEQKEEKYRLIKTHDYVRPEDIGNFFSTDKKTTTVLFNTGRVMTYRITEEEFKKKFEGLITIRE